MNYYPFHVGDYMLHTAHLSPMEDLAYRRLIDLYYTHEGPISLDIERVAKLIRMRDQIEIVQEVLSDFFVKSDAGYVSKRCDEEIAKYNAKASRAKAANEKRWGSEKNSDIKNKSETASHLTSDKKSDLKSDLKSETLSDPNQNQNQNHISTPPISPKGESMGGDSVAESKRSKRSAAITFSEWIARVRASGEKAVSDYATVWEYADDVKLPSEFIELAWLSFKERFTTDERAKRKRYIDWRLHFLNYVKRNYLKLWAWSQKDGCWFLTSVGIQERMKAEAEAS